MLRQHDGLPGGENYAELLPDLAARNQFSGSGGEIGKLHVDHHDISYTRGDSGTSLEFFRNLW